MPDVAIIESAGPPDRWGVSPDGAVVVVRDVVTYPRRSDETSQNSIITGINAIFPPGTEVPDAVDAVMVGIDVASDGTWVDGTGKRYEVIGDPGVWAYLDGEEAGTEVALERVKG